MYNNGSEWKGWMRGMEITWDGTGKAAARQAPAAFYLCHGDYEFLSKEMCAAILERLEPDETARAGIVQRFDWLEGDAAVEAWIAAAGTPSLFGDNQILIVDNAHAAELRARPNPPDKAKDADKYTNWRLYHRFERVAAEPLAGTHTIFLYHEPLRSVKTKSKSEKFLQRAYALINGHGVIIEFKKLWDNNIVDWLVRRAQSRTLRLSQETAEFFMQWAGSDLRHLASEIDKLASFLPDGSVVSEQIVRDIVTSSESQFVYQMFDAVMAGNGGEALRLLDMSLRGTADPVYIAASFAGVMRDLWQARFLLDRGCFKKMPGVYRREATIAEINAVGQSHKDAMGVDKGASLLTRSPYNVYHSVRRARLLKQQSIERVMLRVMDIDCKLKGIRRPAPGQQEILLQTLIADLAYTVRKAAVPRQRARR